MGRDGMNVNNDPKIWQPGPRTIPINPDYSPFPQLGASPGGCLILMLYLRTARPPSLALGMTTNSRWRVAEMAEG